MTITGSVVSWTTMHGTLRHYCRPQGHVEHGFLECKYCLSGCCLGKVTAVPEHAVPSQQQILHVRTFSNHPNEALEWQLSPCQSCGALCCLYVERLHGDCIRAVKITECLVWAISQ